MVVEEVYCDGCGAGTLLRDSRAAGKEAPSALMLVKPTSSVFYHTVSFVFSF